MTIPFQVYQELKDNSVHQTNLKGKEEVTTNDPTPPPPTPPPPPPPPSTSNILDLPALQEPPPPVLIQPRTHLPLPTPPGVPDKTTEIDITKNNNNNNQKERKKKKTLTNSDTTTTVDALKVRRGTRIRKPTANAKWQENWVSTWKV